VPKKVEPQKMRRIRSKLIFQQRGFAGIRKSNFTEQQIAFAFQQSASGTAIAKVSHKMHKKPHSEACRRLSLDKELLQEVI
jgi:hypothetical protein